MNFVCCVNMSIVTINQEDLILTRDKVILQYISEQFLPYKPVL